MRRIDGIELSKIDGYFDLILENPKNYKAYEDIARSLEKIFGKKFSVTVNFRKSDEKLYMMTVTPSDNVMSSIVIGILNGVSDSEIANKWNNETNWNISIDSRILDGSVISFTNRELTAMILHECGHIIDSNMIPYRICKTMRFQSSKLGIGLRKVSSNGIFVKMLQFPIIKSCSLKKASASSLQKEMRADLYATKSGYGNELQSVFSKIIKYNDGTYNLGSNIGDEQLKEMEQDMLFSIETIEGIKKRDTNLVRKNFTKMILDMPSHLALDLSDNVKKIVFNGDIEKSSLNESLLESVDSLYENSYIMEAFSILKKKMKRIDPSIMDYVTIRKDSIKTNDEKLMLVQYIYSKLDLIDYYLSIMDNPKYEKRYIFANTKNELIHMKEYLNQARIDILNYKVPITQYGIQVLYPDGYYG